MSHAKILDCTLRDGAYLVDKKFGDDVINSIIKGLMKAKIDLIEIGFFQDEGLGLEKLFLKIQLMQRDLFPRINRGVSLLSWQIRAGIH